MSPARKIPARTEAPRAARTLTIPESAIIKYDDLVLDRDDDTYSEHHTRAEADRDCAEVNGDDGSYTPYRVVVRLTIEADGLPPTTEEIEAARAVLRRAGEIA